VEFESRLEQIFLRCNQCSDDVKSLELLRKHVGTRNVSMISQIAGMTGLDRVYAAKVIVTVAEQMGRH
jgi:hypothetical protein